MNRSKFQLHSHYINKHNITISLITDINCDYMFWLKLLLRSQYVNTELHSEASKRTCSLFCVSARFNQPNVASQNDKNISKRIKSTLVLRKAHQIRKAKLLPSFFFIRLQDWGHNRNAISKPRYDCPRILCAVYSQSARCTLPSVTPHLKSFFSYSVNAMLPAMSHTPGFGKLQSQWRNLKDVLWITGYCSRQPLSRPFTIDGDGEFPA
jgi:hypothetical protein